MRWRTLSLACLALLAACAQAPETGRNQLILPFFGDDAELGFQAFEQIKDEKEISDDPTMNAAVQRVGRAIAEISPQPDWDWEFVVFDDDTPNAFALPGGKVGVNTGLFKVAKTDDQLAAVIGHEVAHAIARHGVERMSSGLLTQLGVVAAGIASDNQAIAAGLAGAATLGYTLPHSRTQESEADAIGLRYMARAGYDPRAAVKLWENMEAYGGDQPPQFLSTHPSHGNRIARLEELMPEALEEYRGR